MHDYLLSTEWVRFAFVVGIVTSMLLYERRHLTTGSIVVPGYIAVFIIHPLVLIATFANAAVTYVFVNKLLRRHVLLYGRTKFTVLAVVSTLVQTLMLQFTPSDHWLWERDVLLFVGVGYVVPALIAHDMARQGVMKTTKSVLLAGSIVAVPIAAAIALDLPGVNDLAPIDGYGSVAYPASWLPIAIVISILASWAVAHNYRGRSGGFVGAAFLSVFVADPWQVVAAIVIAVAAYFIVTRFLMNSMILFGRRKFSAMLLTSSAITWPALWIGERVLGESVTSHLAVGSLALTPFMLPGLIANDIQRASFAKVTLGLSLAGLCTLTMTWWIGATITGQHLALGWRLVAIASVVVLTWPQLRRLLRRAALAVEAAVIDAEGLTDRIRALRTATIDSIRRYPMRALAGVTTLERRADLGVIWLRRPAGGATLGALVPSGRGLAIAMASSGGDDDHSGPTATWRAWASRHPDIAAEAEAWLEAQLQATASAPAPIARTRSDPGPSLDDFARQALTRSLQRSASLTAERSLDAQWWQRGGHPEAVAHATPTAPLTPLRSAVLVSPRTAVRRPFRDDYEELRPGVARRERTTPA